MRRQLVNLRRSRCISVFLWSLLTMGPCSCTHNSTAWRSLRRQKRFLIFENSGVSKLVCGAIMPVDLSDKKPWRQLNWAINMQAQYAVPTTPIYWWDKWDGRTLQKAKFEFESFGTYVKDRSRQLLYITIEMYLNRAGKNGPKCLQRAICENAEVDVVEGIFAEIIHLALNPTGDENVSEEYHEAFRAGRSGAICRTLYPECPFGQGLLDNIAVTKVIEYLK